MKRKIATRVAEMKAQYVLDYSTAIRGKYHKRLLGGGANIIMLDPDVAKVFRSSVAVNDALRGLLSSRNAGSPVSGKSRRRSRVRRPAD